MEGIARAKRGGRDRGWSFWLVILGILFLVSLILNVSSVKAKDTSSLAKKDTCIREVVYLDYDLTFNIPNDQVIVSNTGRFCALGQNIKRGVFLEFPKAYFEPVYGAIVPMEFKLLEATIDGKAAIAKREESSGILKVYLGSGREFLSRGWHNISWAYATRYFSRTVKREFWSDQMVKELNIDVAKVAQYEKWTIYSIDLAHFANLQMQIGQIDMYFKPFIAQEVFDFSYIVYRTGDGQEKYLALSKLRDTPKMVVKKVSASGISDIKIKLDLQFYEGPITLYVAVPTGKLKKVYDAVVSNSVSGRPLDEEQVEVLMRFRSFDDYYRFAGSIADTLNLEAGIFRVIKYNIWLILALFGTIFWAGWGYYLYKKYGKDPEPIAVPPQYTPPARLGPAKIAAVLNRCDVTPKQILTEFIYYEIQGAIKFEKQGKVVRVLDRTKIKDACSSRLLPEKEEVEIKGKWLYGALNNYLKCMRKWCSNFYKPNIALLLLAGFVGVVLAVVPAWLHFSLLEYEDTAVGFLMVLFTLLGVAALFGGIIKFAKKDSRVIGFFTLGIFAISLMLFRFVEVGLFGWVGAIIVTGILLLYSTLDRYTQEGIDLLRDALGFKKFIERADLKRIEKAVGKDGVIRWFEETLPYAISMGLFKRFIKRYKHALKTLTTIGEVEDYERRIDERISMWRNWSRSYYAYASKVAARSYSGLSRTRGSIGAGAGGGTTGTSGGGW